MIDSLDFLIVMVILYLIECLRRVGPDELTLDRRLHSGFPTEATNALIQTACTGVGSCSTRLGRMVRLSH